MIRKFLRKVSSLKSCKSDRRNRFLAKCFSDGFDGLTNIFSEPFYNSSCILNNRHVLFSKGRIPGGIKIYTKFFYGILGIYQIIFHLKDYDSRSVGNGVRERKREVK